MYSTILPRYMTNFISFILCKNQKSKFPISFVLNNHELLVKFSIHRHYNSSNILHTAIHKEEVKKRGNNTKKNKEQKIFVSVIDQNQKESVLPLDDAKKLAKHRGMSLIKIPSPTVKSSLEFYKLAITDSYYKSGTNTKNKMKTVVIGSNISDHDLHIKMKQAIKSLNKYGVLECLVQSSSFSNSSLMDIILSKITNIVNESGVSCKISQINQKRTSTKMVLKLKDDVDKTPSEIDNSSDSYNTDSKDYGTEPNKID